MSVGRSPAAIRGTLVGRSVQTRYRPRPEAPEDVVDPTKPRRVVVYTLQRRTALHNLFSGAVFSGVVADNPLDAHPYLLRAARFHGRQTDRHCPVCKEQRLTNVNYAFSDEFPRDSNGGAHSQEMLDELAQSHGFITVYVVEVCLRCHWNHILISYVIGDGQPRRAGG